MRKWGSAMIGYVIGSLLVAYGLFRLIVEAQAREDEQNEREMLMNRDWDMP